MPGFCQIVPGKVKNRGSADWREQAREAGKPAWNIGFSAFSACFGEKTGEHLAHLVLPAVRAGDFGFSQVRNFHDKAEYLFAGMTPELVRRHKRPPVSWEEHDSTIKP